MGDPLAMHRDIVLLGLVERMAQRFSIEAVISTPAGEKRPSTMRSAARCSSEADGLEDGSGRDMSGEPLWMDDSTGVLRICELVRR